MNYELKKLHCIFKQKYELRIMNYELQKKLHRILNQKYELRIMNYELKKNLSYTQPKV